MKSKIAVKLNNLKMLSDDLLLRKLKEVKETIGIRGDVETIRYCINYTWKVLKLKEEANRRDEERLLG